MVKLSQRANKLQPSATLAITAKAKKMRSEGIDVIGFGAGEPDFATPSHIIDAAIGSLRAGDTHYTPVGGTAELKNAIIQSIKRDYDLDYASNEVTVNCGAKHTLYNIFMSILDPGDEVIIPAPYWVSYPEQVALADGVPVILETSEADGFMPDPEKLAALITPRTKAIVLNSPSNPSGSMIDAAGMKKIADVVAGTDVLVISDDIYHRLLYDGTKFVSILEVAPSLRDQVVIVNGVSKTYAMTGWRIGYALGPQSLIGAMEKLQGQSTSNPTSFAQKGVIEALTGDQSCVGEMVGIFARRRALLVDGLNALPGITCRMPVGAFYAFPNVSGVYGSKTPAGARITDSFSLAGYLLEDALVAVVPGAPFGSDANVRMSYATGEEAIEKGLSRMAVALAKLS